MFTDSEDDFERAVVAGRKQQRKPRYPKRISDVVNRLLAKRGYGKLQEWRQWAEIWRAVSGSTITENSRVVGVNRGVLEVVVGNSTALQELTFNKQRLLKDLQEHSSRASVRDVRFRIGEID